MRLDSVEAIHYGYENTFHFYVAMVASELAELNVGDHTNLSKYSGIYNEERIREIARILLDARNELITNAYDFEKAIEVWEKAGPGGPEVMLSWDYPEHKSWPGLSTEKQLHVENTGATEAVNVQIQKVELTKQIAATFRELPRLKPGESLRVNPLLVGKVPENHLGEFLMVVYAAGHLPPQYEEYDSTHNNLIAVRFPITVTFQGYSEETYRARFEFKMDTVNHAEQVRFLGRDRLRPRSAAATS